MKKRLLLATILLGWALDAMRAATPESLDPLSFDTASEEAREYVIDSLAACVREANVAFLQCRRDPPGRPTTDPIPIGRAIKTVNLQRAQEICYTILL